MSTSPDVLHGVCATSEQPIFIIGAPRSGTTLLRYALCMHPNLFVPPESNFIPRFLRECATGLLTREQAIQTMTDIRGYNKFFKDWQERELPDSINFVDALPDLRLATLLNALYQRYAAQYQAGRWGDKSPIYTVYVDEIARVFPNAQFIHIIRDGRDVALSMIKAYSGRRFFYMNLGFAAHSWQWRVRQARASGARLGPDRYHELRYEALTADPESTLKSICAYLDEPYAREMTQPNRLASQQHHSQGIYAATRQPITTKSTGRWQWELSAADQRLLHRMIGAYLDELGYTANVAEKLSPTEWTRLVRYEIGYLVLELGRRTLQAGGIFHPTNLLAKR